MADPRFFAVAGPFGLGQLADIAGARLSDGADPQAAFTDVAPLEAAGPGNVSFLDNKRYVDAFRVSRAGACVVHPSDAPEAPPGMLLLLTDRPYRGYARIAQAFYPTPRRADSAIHPTATVDPKAILGKQCRVEAGAVIGAGAEIGNGCRIGPNAIIGDGVVLGEDCVVGACASLSHCLVGSRVVIYPGVRIGQDGFGFAMDAAGHEKVPQLGRVIVHDDVEIGANTTIDRGSGPDTVIGAGCMIDNLVQIGHNVQLGRGCVVVAQAGIAGSTRLEDFVIVAAQVGIIGHVTIGRGARLAAQCGVMRTVAPGENVGGSPAIPLRQFMRQVATLARLAKRTEV